MANSKRIASIFFQMSKAEKQERLKRLPNSFQKLL